MTPWLVACQAPLSMGFSGMLKMIYAGSSTILQMSEDDFMPLLRVLSSWLNGSNSFAPQLTHFRCPLAQCHR